MNRIKSKISTKSPDYKENYENSLRLVEELKERYSKIKLGGPETARQKHISRGKLLTRDRIQRLLDPNTPFLEIAPFAAYDMYENQAPSAGMVTGIGIVHSREVMIVPTTLP
jgi:Acetyl-CoA carboxylase, carboxyltransferase component (subunits alpha and beta)